MLLKPNMNWEKNCGIALPTVMANVHNDGAFLQVDFFVEEPLDCFRSEVMEDGGNSWEDSCVEIFIENPSDHSEYYNFETTSRGFILAAHGPDRENRTPLSSARLAQIERSKQLASVIGDFISWNEGVQLRGNLYKCADKAKTPHYLSAFPIETEKPDFHRPEFFNFLV